ncbi:alginate lyase family protein [Pseudorhizobium pelagicum]|uniref:alginate lyase family protein n=1 Tax=Pseudorhizobium pelagicum TaxID=1509405 RepID=UPI00068D0FD5|nr:alginate lyase family protein [Pseudorhizobium pelagicum]
MNAIWLMNRLRSMSMAEVAWRVREQVLRAAARRNAGEWERYGALGSRAPQLPGLRSALERASGPIREATRAASGRVLAGDFCALGVAWPRLETDPDFPAHLWTLDPVSGQHWPGVDTFSFDINYKDAPGFGDIKYAWEFHRLQFLQPVAAHYLLSGDKSALDFLDRAINSWFIHNPPYRGIGWNSGIELALRSISLLVVSSCCGDDLSFPTRSRIRQILASHLAWMLRFPSKFSSANNHLVAECAGEFLISLAMPELSGSRGNLAKAQAALEREAGTQILADGVGAEQSPTYGAFTAEFLLLCAKAARDSGRPMDPSLNASLTRFAAFIGWISLADGTTPKIGDDDEGRVLSLAEDENCYPTSVASAICGHLNIPPLGPAPDKVSLRAAVFDSPTIGAAAPSGSKVFDTGGYSVFRGKIAEKPAMVLFDHGPLGYLSIAAHGHADALSWQLFLRDRPVLVDPGTYLYHAGGAWRDWFRSTQAHNTLALGGRDQSTISGAFNWSHKAKAELLEHRREPTALFRASHDGYVKAFRLVHERTLSIASSSIQVTDRLLGSSAPPRVDMIYQLAPGIHAEVEGQHVHLSVAGEPVLRIDFPSDGAVAVLAGQEPPQCGWVSPSFGTKLPSARIVWTAFTCPPSVKTQFHII